MIVDTHIFFKKSEENLFLYFLVSSFGKYHMTYYVFDVARKTGEKKIVIFYYARSLKTNEDHLDHVYK